MNKYRLSAGIISLSATSLVADFVLLFASSYAVQWLHNQFAEKSDDTYLHIGVVVAISVIWVLIMLISGVYNSRVLARDSEEYVNIGKSTIIVWLCVAFVVIFFKIPHALLIVAAILPVGYLTVMFEHKVMRTVVSKARTRNLLCSNAMIVLFGEEHDDFLKHHKEISYLGYRVVALASVEANKNDLVRFVEAFHIPAENFVEGLDRLGEQIIANRIGTVICLGRDSFTRSGIIQVQELAMYLERYGAELLISSDLPNLRFSNVAFLPIGEKRLLRMSLPRYEGWAYLVKGVFDRVSAFIGLVILIPVFAIVGGVIKLEDSGPVFYRQKRVGKNGVTFMIWKFRSMVPNAHELKDSLVNDNEGSGPLFKMKKDPRVTKVGSFIRKYSIDELPQLINVLTGSMSLVGPRPPLPEEVQRYSMSDSRRLLVKPGITGLWQISGRSDLSWEKSVKLDLYYVDSWKWTTDLMILFRTFKVVIRGDGAY